MAMFRRRVWLSGVLRCRRVVKRGCSSIYLMYVTSSFHCCLLSISCTAGIMANIGTWTKKELVSTSH